MTSDLHHHDAFVAVDLPAGDLRRRLEERLGIAFEPHESSFWNGDYDLHTAGAHAEIKIISNGPDRWFDTYPPDAVVVLVASTAATRHLPEAVAGIDGILLHEHRESAPPAPGSRGLANDLYGSPALTARALLDRVAPALGLTWTHTDGEWTAAGPGEEDLSLYDNADRSRLRHPEMLALLRVGATTRSAQLRALLEEVDGLVHLDHREY